MAVRPRHHEKRGLEIAHWRKTCPAENFEQPNRAPDARPKRSGEPHRRSDVAACFTRTALSG